MSSTNKLVILGAGASRGTSANVPTSLEFGKTLATIAKKNKYPVLNQIAEQLGFKPGEWPLHDLWTWIDYQSKLTRTLGAHPNRLLGQAVSELPHALLAVYGKCCDDIANRLPTRGSYTLLNVLKPLRKGDHLVSFNYDVIAERVFDQIKPNTLFSDPAKQGVILAKPHGSTSWWGDIKTKRVNWDASGRPLLHSLPTDYDERVKQTLMLGAVPIKSELIDEVQRLNCWTKIFETISDEWKKLLHALRVVDSVEVVGYSFPPEDQYGRFLIRETLRTRGGKKLKLAFYELPARRSSTAKAIFDVFRDQIGTLEYCGPVEPPD